MTVSLDDQIACVERELKMRHRVYRGMVYNGKMTEADKNRELNGMTAVLQTLKNLKQGALL